MSFLNPDKEQASVSKIYSRIYSWKGGSSELINPERPEEGERRVAKIKWVEGSGKNKTEGFADIPMKIAVIGVTFGVGAYIKGQQEGTEVMYYSNETTQWGQELRVTKSTARGAEPAARGGYQEVKNAIPQLKSQYNVYFYDFERKCIDRFSFVGSSYGAWKEYNKSVGRDKYTAPTLIEVGEYKKFDVGAAFLPKFSLGTPYTEAEITEISKMAIKMDEFEKYLESGAATGGEGGADEYDQTPAQYDGEGNQELPPAPAPEEGGIDLGDVPF